MFPKSKKAKYALAIMCFALALFVMIAHIVGIIIPQDIRNILWVLAMLVLCSSLYRDYKNSRNNRL